MEILRGSPALSAFRISRLLTLFQQQEIPITDIYAEYVHFADLAAPLSDSEKEKLDSLLKYGYRFRNIRLSGGYYWLRQDPELSLHGHLKLPISRIIVV